MAAVRFVGRSSELARLGALLAEAAERKPVTALLAGDAGVGKSRLLDEFATAARETGAHVLRGACIELGGGAIPYAPLIEALRLLVREHGEPKARRLAGPAWAELAGLIRDFTGAAPEQPPEPGPRSQLYVFGAVLRMLDHLGAQSPLVLVFEDVHWADPSTRDLVSYLTRATSTERTMLICSHRTDLASWNPLQSLLAEPDFVRRVHRIELGRFTEPELRAFAGELGVVDRDLVRRCFELSDGNAFFAEQLVASGVLSGAGAGRVPASLNELMLSRIRVLGKNALRLVRVAATSAGRVVDSLLAAVCRLDDDIFDEALRECLDTGILVADPADDTYTFHSTLIREAVYGSLVPRERRRLHTEMATAIAADGAHSGALNGAESLSAAVELAHHWYSAGRTTEALFAALRAGEATVRMRAFHEAETQYQRVLHLWNDVPADVRPAGLTREKVLAAAADAARWAGHVAQAVEYVRQALAEVDPVRQPRRAGELYERLGSYQWEAGVPDESLHAYTEAERLLGEDEPDTVNVRVLAGLATADLRAGRYAEGLERGNGAVALADRLGAQAEKGRALNSVGLALAMVGRGAEGVPLLKEALQIADRSQHLEDLLRAYANLGLAYDFARDMSSAAKACLAGLALARKLGLAATRQGGVLANNASAALAQLGRWDEAAGLLEESLADHPHVRESAYPRLTLAEIEVARGRFAAADRLIGEIKPLPNPDRVFLGSLRACEAELALWRDDPDAAQLAVDSGLAEIGDAEHLFLHLRLCATGLRAAADRQIRGTDAADAATRGDDLLQEARRVAVRQPRQPELRALLRMCEVERERASHKDTPEQWRDIAAKWDELERPYLAAYSRWRQAAATASAGNAIEAGELARAAAAEAEKLEALPLRRAVGAMIGGDAGAGAGAGAGRMPGERTRELTRRETEVLRELAGGRSNREIAQNLFIAENTVGVHVNHILAKLEARSRGEAAATARRRGLLDDAAESGRDAGD